MPILLKRQNISPLADIAVGVGQQRLQQVEFGQNLQQQQQQMQQQQYRDAAIMNMRQQRNAEAQRAFQNDMAQQQMAQQGDLRQQQLGQQAALGYDRMASQEGIAGLRAGTTLQAQGMRQQGALDLSLQNHQNRLAQLAETAKYRQLTDAENAAAQESLAAINNASRQQLQGERLDYGREKVGWDETFKANQAELTRKSREKIAADQYQARLNAIEAQSQRAAATSANTANARETQQRIAILRARAQAASARMHAAALRLENDPEADREMNDVMGELKQFEFPQPMQQPGNIGAGVGAVIGGAMSVGQVVTNRAGQQARIVGQDANGQILVEPLA